MRMTLLPHARSHDGAVTVEKGLSLGISVVYVSMIYR